MPALTPSRIYCFNEQGINFNGTFTLHAARVEKWIPRVQEEFLDNSPIKCVRMDVEYTDTKPNLK
jgi:hypothetical protein